MIKNMKNKELDVARCVGLWLAEGDTKSKAEITLTNNSQEIITFFHNVISKLFISPNKPRIYVYSPNEDEKPKLPVDALHKYYIDVRANKPYFIYRLADVKIVKKWHKIVETLKQKSKFYPFILQGFFAGEGSIKLCLKSSQRVLRISQSKINPYLETILNHFDVHFKFNPSHREYEIWNRKNLINLAKINIAELHPQKRNKFKLLMKSFKQRKRKHNYPKTQVLKSLKYFYELYKCYPDPTVRNSFGSHSLPTKNKSKKSNKIEMKEIKNYIYYPKGFLKKEIFSILTQPFNTNEISFRFNRSMARVGRVLGELKKESKVKNFRVRSVDYWIRNDKNIVIISKRKQEILNFLEMPKYTFQIAKYLQINWKAAFRRLKELEKLNLVKFAKGLWYKTPIDKEVIVI